MIELRCYRACIYLSRCDATKHAFEDVQRVDACRNVSLWLGSMYLLAFLQFEFIDSTCTVIGIDLDPVDVAIAAQSDGVVILRQLPLAIIANLHNVTTEFLPPIPCSLHAADAAKRECLKWMCQLLLQIRATTTSEFRGASFP